MAVGADLNPLATFVSRAKTSLHTTYGLAEVDRWADRIYQSLNVHHSPQLEPRWERDGYLRHLGTRDAWRIRDLIAIALGDLDMIGDSSARRLARCAVLRSGQWALDMRAEIPSVEDFQLRLVSTTHQMTAVAREYTRAVRIADKRAHRIRRRRTTVLDQGLPGLSEHPAIRDRPPVRLLLTSPPYPGVYVNYHRWKVRGRKETPAPFWVVNSADGRGMAHYTMSATSADGNSPGGYFAKLAAAWSDLHELVGDTTRVVQVVGFKEPDAQLEQYLDVMTNAGFTEERFDDLATRSDGRLWRRVPGRRWWVTARQRQGVAPHTAMEVVLLHRPT